MAVTIRFTNVFDQLVKAARTNRYLILYGGSSSSKTISILQYLTIYALKHSNKRITISAESLPIIKKTILPDWKDHVMLTNFDEARFNKSEMVYTFPNGSVFNFIPADDDARWHGLRQDIVYFDELFNIPKTVYEQADIRTKDKIISSFNPVSSFWIQQNFNDEDTAVLHSTYKDNPYVSAAIIKSLEKRISTDKNFYEVYVLGKFGSLDGQVFIEGTNWSVTDKFPTTYSDRVICGDFGFTNHPTSIIDLRYANGELWAKELVYKTGLINATIASILRPLKTRTVLDAAEPKSIAEIRNEGINVYKSQKGPDSIRQGINLLKKYKLNITKDSINTIKELRNYQWEVSKEGEPTNKPVDKWNHSCDALRYGAFDLFNKRNVFFI